MVADLHTIVEACVKRHICKLLDVYDWDKPKTAKALGIGLSTLYRKIDALGIKKGRVFT